MAARQPCKDPVKVVTPSGKEVELVPKKVWALSPRARKGVKMGLFQDPETGRFFRRKVPDDYPICG